MAKSKKAKQELISHSDYVLILWSSWKHWLQFGMIIQFDLREVLDQIAECSGRAYFIHI